MKCSFHYQIQPLSAGQNSTAVHKPRFTSIYCRAILYRPYLIFNTVAQITHKEIGHFFFLFSSRAPLFNMQRPLPTLHNNAYRSSAPRNCTVSLRSFSTRCLGCTHSFFFSRALRRGRSKYVKIEWNLRAAPTSFFVIFIIISPRPNYSTTLLPDNATREQYLPNSATQ